MRRCHGLPHFSGSEATDPLDRGRATDFRLAYPTLTGPHDEAVVFAIPKLVSIKNPTLINKSSFIYANYKNDNGSVTFAVIVKWLRVSKGTTHFLYLYHSAS